MGDVYSYKEHESERKKLYEVIPLKFPYAVDFLISNVCNFKCFYCLQSKEKNEREKYFKDGIRMTFEVFKKCIDNIKANGKLKVLTISGNGEPFLNSEIVQMVHYAVESKVAESVEIVTNASLLTHELSRGLVEAGLSRLRVSLQGLDSESYKKVSNITLDYERVKKEIQYFYQIREKTVLYIKIMDFMVKEKGKKIQFFQEYKEYCDQIAIENLIPFYDEIDYSISESKFENALHNNMKARTVEGLCSRPFFHCAIGMEGEIMPCCIMPSPIIYGNATENFIDAWNGKVRTEFLIDLLKDERYKYNTCKRCHENRYRLRESDNLDKYANELILRLERQ